MMLKFSRKKFLFRVSNSSKLIRLPVENKGEAQVAPFAFHASVMAAGHQNDNQHNNRIKEKKTNAAIYAHLSGFDGDSRRL